MRTARAALVFLTRFPAGPLAAEDFARAPGWFAAVGLIIGGAQAAVWLLASLIWPPIIAALLAVAAGLMMTGALHEDGLADTFDGLGSRRPAARALEIMRDSQIGSFGALALGMVVAARVLALVALGPNVVWALIAGQSLSRAAMTVILRLGPYLRPAGAGSAMAGPLGNTWLAWVFAVLLALALTAWATGWAVLAGLAGLVIGSASMWLWSRRRLGGVTGDILGASQALGDLGFLLGLLACP